MILTGGQTLGGIDYDSEKPTFYAVAEKWEPLPKEYYEKGAKLLTAEHMREMPKFKTTNYIEAVKLQKKKGHGGSRDSLYLGRRSFRMCDEQYIYS